MKREVDQTKLVFRLLFQLAIVAFILSGAAFDFIRKKKTWPLTSFERWESVQVPAPQQEDMYTERVYPGSPIYRSGPLGPDGKIITRYFWHRKLPVRTVRGKDGELTWELMK